MCFVWSRLVSIAFRGSSPKHLSAMTRVFEKQVFEAVAANATEASPKDVLKRFYVPIVGTLRCKYVGPLNSEEKDVIVFNTNVVFKWELSAPHVKGSVEQDREASEQSHASMCASNVCKRANQQANGKQRHAQTHTHGAGSAPCGACTGPVPCGAVQVEAAPRGELLAREGRARALVAGYGIVRV